MEAEIKELWLYFSRLYLAKYGEPPTLRISDKDKIILAILDLQNDTQEDDDDYDFD